MPGSGSEKNKLIKLIEPWLMVFNTPVDFMKPLAFFYSLIDICCTCCCTCSVPSNVSTKQYSTFLVYKLVKQHIYCMLSVYGAELVHTYKCRWSGGWRKDVLLHVMHEKWAAAEWVWQWVWVMATCKVNWLRFLLIQNCTVAQNDCLSRLTYS